MYIRNKKQQIVKKILVTGGAGYIGAHTVLALIKENFIPIIADNFSNSNPKILEKIEKITGKKLKVYQTDCTKNKDLEKIFEQEKIDGIIHFAALKAVGESVKEPLLYYQNNLNALLNILENIKKYKIPDLIFSSSATVYGNPIQLPVHESTPLQAPTNPYGATKQIGEQMIFDFFKSEKLKNTNFGCVILRYFNPIGAEGEIGEIPNGVPNNLVPYLSLVAQKKLPYLSIFGGDYPTPDGTCIRDYIDVRDLAQAHVRSLHFLTEKKELEIFNIGVGKGCSVLECVQAFEKVNHIKVPYQIVGRRTGDVAEIYADNQKAKKYLNWDPKYSLAESLEKVWEWQQNMNL